MRRMRVKEATVNERTYLSVAQVALMMGVSAATVRRKVAEGEIPAVRLGGPGNTIRIPAGQFDAWLARHATGTSE